MGRSRGGLLECRMGVCHGWQIYGSQARSRSKKLEWLKLIKLRLRCRQQLLCSTHAAVACGKLTLYATRYTFVFVYLYIRRSATAWYPVRRRCQVCRLDYEKDISSWLRLGSRHATVTFACCECCQLYWPSCRRGCCPYRSSILAKKFWDQHIYKFCFFIFGNFPPYGVRASISESAVNSFCCVALTQSSLAMPIMQRLLCPVVPCPAAARSSRPLGACGKVVKRSADNWKINSIYLWWTVGPHTPTHIPSHKTSTPL